MLLDVNPLVLPDIGLIIWTTLAFLLLIFLLGKYAWKPILKAVNEREATITNALESAEKVKLEMAQLKNDNETLLAKAREERAQLLKEAKETKDKIVNDAKEEAKTQATKIINEAQAIINQQKMAAVNDLKNQVGKLVIEVSEKILRRELSNKTEQENYIKQLSDEVKLN